MKDYLAEYNKNVAKITEERRIRKSQEHMNTYITTLKNGKAGICKANSTEEAALIFKCEKIDVFHSRSF